MKRPQVHQGPAAGAKLVTPAEKDDYFRGAASWEADRVRSAQRSEAVAWIVAGCSGLCTMGAIVALVLMTPLKTVVPYVIKVDKSTGETEIVDVLKGPPGISDMDAVTRHFLGQYTRLREGWLPQAADQNSYAVGAMSDPTEAARYRDAMIPSNPSSPAVSVGNAGFVEVAVRSVSFLSSSVAQVRYTKITTRGATPPVAVNWVATMTFRYTSAPTKERDRLLNPLGFQVENWRADPEV